MEFRFAEDGSQVALSGRLTFPDHQVFRTVVARLLESARDRVAIDLSGTDFIDSAGLGMLLIARDEALKIDRRVVLQGPRGQVRRLFEISKLTAIFEIEE